MNDPTSENLDQTDEDMLTYTVSDQALEAAGRPWIERGATFCSTDVANCCPWTSTVRNPD